MKLFDDLNKARKKVGLPPLLADPLAAQVFNTKATSYAFHFSLSKEMIHLVGSLATGYSASLSGNSHALKTLEACCNRGLMFVSDDRGKRELTRVGCAVALMLEAGNFITLDSKEIKALKRRI